LPRRLIDLARPRYLMRSWQARLPGGRGGVEPVLGPSHGIGSRPALVLALQLGLNLTGGQLSELFHRSGEEVGEDLYAARRALDPKLPMPCPDRIPALGRYRDPSLGVNERVGLLRHTADCAGCRTVLERFQQIDAGLLKELDRQRAELGNRPLPGVSLPSRLAASPAALILVVVLALTLIAGAAGIGLSRLAGNHHHPVPLIAAATADATAQIGVTQPTGWLILTTTDNGVEAVNLTTAEQRTIVPGNASQGGGSFQMLSPDRTLLATLGPEQSNGEQPIPVVIRRLDGTVVANHQLSYSSDSIPWLLSWLDNQTILVGEEPASRLNSPPVPLEVTVDAVNIRTWQSRRFFAGNVGTISISPNGKLALVTDGYDPNWLGVTMELRPVLPGGVGLGAPLATVEHRGNPGTPSAVWAPDSNRVYVSRIDDADILQSTPGSINNLTYAPKQVSIIAIDRQGHVSTVLAPNTGTLATPISISADGRTIYYQYEPTETPATDDNQAPVATIWSMRTDGSRREKIDEVKALAGPAAILTAGWDTSTSLYLAGREPYLNGEQPVTVSGGPLTWPVVVAYPAGHSPVPVLSLPNITPFEALAWLPENALPGQATASGATQPVTGAPSAPETVPGIPSYLVTDASSSVSGDGHYAVLSNLAGHDLEIIDRSNAILSRELDQDDTDPSWVPGQDIVMTASRPTQYIRSRLMLSAPAPPAGNDYPLYDSARFDPANLEQAPPSQVYAAPTVSPDGLSTAFFVLDRAGNNVALWLAQAGHPAVAVDHWLDGTKQSGTLPLLATWVDSRTLLYAMPGSWKNNLPQQPELVRLTLQPDGTFDQTVLLTLPESGFDRGIAIVGMALSQDGQHLALRVRHYGHADHTSGVSDAILVMPASDLGQQVQIEQAAPGSGLNWSPSGNWLTFGLNGKVEIASANGATLHEVALPAGTTGASPLWVSSNEIWFTQDDGLQRALRRVVVR
ncbi:MAG TPA: hypothetical protein VKU87_12510, partial [Thermomicrobiaceae bacterium]|nr:hypothetical protein [Thermomicrobiaceae bacterium]